MPHCQMASKFTDGLNFWPAVIFGFSGTLFLGQLHPGNNWTLHCSYVRMILLLLYALLKVIHVSYLAVSTVVVGTEMQWLLQNSLNSFRCIVPTVEPPSKGHVGSRAFVLISEVVLWWEVRANMQFIAPSRSNIP